MRILLTGSSGRVGAAIAAGIADKHEVIGLDLVGGLHTRFIGSITDGALVADLISDIDAVIHTASLHAPHVGVSSDSAFYRTNLDGTETLLDACLRQGVGRFIYTSTTSLYGAAMVQKGRAAWVTEELVPVPRDIYDQTKIAAEQACRAAAGDSMTCVSLRISRCFPEPGSLMALYRLYRGVDLRDLSRAHALALSAPIRGFEVFNISAASPFVQADCEDLYTGAQEVIARYHPWAPEAFRRRGWALPNRIDRVYVIEKARRVLGYRPKYNFASMLRADAARS